MSTVPRAPNLKLNPVASNNTLNFYWTAPTDDGGSRISCYNLLCSSIPYSTSINATSTYCQVTGLTNNQNYTFQLAATSAVGRSQFTPFLIAQPGVPPGGPSNIAVSTINSTTANVTWSFSTNTNEGQNKSFVITVVPSSLSSYYIPVYQDQRSQLISNLSSPMLYTIIVQSVSDNEWSYPSLSSIAYMGVAPPPPPLLTSNGSTLAGWTTDGGQSISNIIGNPTPSISLSGGNNGMYRQVTSANSNTTYQFDIYLTAYRVWFNYGCDVAGANGGSIAFWSETNSGQATAINFLYGDYPRPSTGVSVPLNTWHTIKVQCIAGANNTRWYLNGVLQADTYTFNGNGTTLSFVTANGGAAYVDNIIVKTGIA